MVIDRNVKNSFRTVSKDEKRETKLKNEKRKQKTEQNMKPGETVLRQFKTP
jgi:hypothetical protein